MSVIANAKQDLEASVDRLSHSLTTTEERSKVLSERVSLKLQDYPLTISRSLYLKVINLIWKLLQRT